MKKIVFGLLASLVFVACNPAVKQTEVVAEPTQPGPSATPLPTETAVPPTPEPTTTLVPEPNLSPEEMSEQLFTAIEASDLETIEALIEAGVDLSLNNERNQPVLNVAQRQENPLPMIELLVSAGADVDATDRLGNTALILAATGTDDKVEIVSYLLEQGATVNAIGGGGATALIMAAQNGNTAVAEQLILAGADINYQDDTQYQQAPIHWAARNGQFEILKLLLDAGVNIDAVENTNSSAIFYAAYYGHPDIVDHLIDAGADLTIRDTGGKTALSWANGQEIAQMISDAGGTE